MKTSSQSSPKTDGRRPRARSDAAILDWIETWTPVIVHAPWSLNGWSVTTIEGVGIGRSLRAAVLNAMDTMEAADCLPLTDR